MSNWIYWLIGVVVFPLLMGFVNRRYRIVKQSDFRTSEDRGAAVFLSLVACALWPLALALIIVSGTIYLFIRYFVPKE